LLLGGRDRVAFGAGDGDPVGAAAGERFDRLGLLDGVFVGGGENVQLDLDVVLGAQLAGGVSRAGRAGLEHGVSLALSDETKVDGSLLTV
jgi:hypothetical protein